MKPFLIEVHQNKETSFQVLDYNEPYFHNPIHYHSTIELTLITKGEGTRFVGDHIESFFEDDLVLIGSNLPHQWRTNIHSIKNTTTNNAKAIVIHFHKDCFGNDFFLKPESKKIYNLLQFANRGLKITGETQLKVMPLLHKILKSEGFQRTIVLLQILDLISNSTDLIPLASITYRIQNKKSETEKLDHIYEYILKNITEKITLSEIASTFHMSNAGFCRYFKAHSQKTFTKFVLEARVSIACQLLHENKLNISQIAYSTGFNNVSFFNREFKSIKKMTPMNYKKEL